MAQNMKAAFTLTLEDKLTSGLRDIGKSFVDLAKAGKDLGLGKLEAGGDVLRTIGRAARDISSDLRGVEATAERAWVALKRMASVKFQEIGAAGRAVASYGKGLLGPGGLAGAATAAGGAAALVMPTRAYASYENIARHSAITQGLSGPAAEAESKRLMGVFNKDAIETGQTSESIAQAYQDLIQTGIDPKDAELALPTHSRAATAYNTTSESLGHAVGALLRSYQIAPQDLPGTLSSMALASKSGLFKVEDFSSFLPEVGGKYHALGMSGRNAADEAFASLEIVTRNAKDPAQGNANYNDFLASLTAPHSVHSFALDSKGIDANLKAQFNKYNIHGINLPLLLEDARKKGIDPQTGVLSALHKVTARLPIDMKAEVLGAMLGGQNAGSAAQALLQYGSDYEALRNRLHAADPNLFKQDFETARAAPQVALNTGEEVSQQLERRAGEGFTPVVERLVEAGKSLLGFVESLDAKFPGLANAVLVTTGGMLALGAALSAAGFVASALIAGVTLVGGAPVIATAALAAGATAGGMWLINLGVAHDLEQKGYGVPMIGGGLDGTVVNLAGPNFFGQPMGVAPPADAAPAGDTTHKIELTVRSAPGTSAEVTRSSPGVAVTLDPGNTMIAP